MHFIEQIPSEPTSGYEPDEENAAAITLLRSWMEEDLTEDEGELHRRDVENDGLMQRL